MHDGRLLFLFTRVLFPNQIAENREYLFDLYSFRNTPDNSKLAFRYDMIYSKDTRKTSKPQIARSAPEATTSSGQHVKNADPPSRLPRADNVIPTLIQTPQGGFIGYKATKQLVHHVTKLDDLLLLTDEAVANWSSKMLSVKLAQAINDWLKLIDYNDRLGDMIHSWEELVASDDVEGWFR